jgi:hypothetical protein
MIREMQVCLGLPKEMQTGNYGPKTQALLKEKGYDLSGGIIKQTYDAVLADCGQPKERRKLEPIEPIKLSGIKPIPSKIDIKLPELTSLIQMNPQPVNLYNEMKKQGLIKGDANATPLEDGTTLPPTRRVKYKGPDLDSETLDKLDTIISGMGYTRIKQKIDKSYGDKYVWLQN